ncbi:MAG: hypothetical protein M1476_03335 [Candidatus Thermoplasmatota archaeon]|nr:hypothetical protein [Candidatus Thermoplasmatota archaeon]
MKASDFATRIQWARSLREPACLLCTEAFQSHEPAIAIHDSIRIFYRGYLVAEEYPIPVHGRDFYFHAPCYDIVIDQSRKAHKLLVQIVMGHTDRVKGFVEIERMYPFRIFAPSKLVMGGDL